MHNQHRLLLGNRPEPKLGLGAADIELARRAMGAGLLPNRLVHLARPSLLPLFEDHRDPFDRLLIAQAIAEDAAIATSDTRFDAYKQLRVVWD
jgi:PIN domain nuclease of toxin-antitoxin system